MEDNLQVGKMKLLWMPMLSINVSGSATNDKTTTSTRIPLKAKLCSFIKCLK